MNLYKKALFFFLVAFTTLTHAQDVGMGVFFSDAVFRTDTNTFTFHKNKLTVQKTDYVYVKIQNINDAVEVDLFPADASEFEYIKLKESPDYEIIDTLTYNRAAHKYHFAIRFADLATSKFSKANFQLKKHTQRESSFELRFFVFYETSLDRVSDVTDVFQEEEINIEIPGKNLFNVAADPTWKTGEDFDYRTSKDINTFKVTIRPHSLGSRTLSIKPKTASPIVSADNSLVSELPALQLRFNVKPNRLDFVNFDKSDIFYDRFSLQNGEEVQLSYSKNLVLKKTYRIEDSPEPGGNLVAEIFTKSVLSGNKILCWIRPFGLHRTTDGYLYLKDGDRTRFITNVNIIEKARIDKVSILRQNEDWSTNLYVRPGEEIELKFEGTGLLKSQLKLEGINDLMKDSARLSDEIAFYKLTIPADFPRKKMSVFMNKKITAIEIPVREYQRPTQFDFIAVNYGEQNILLNSDVLDKPILYDKVIKDVTLVFDPEKIDDTKALNGKQYLQLEVTITTLKGELKETYKKDLVICPGENSVRYSNYDPKDCNNSNFNLNDLLNQKTYNMEGYTQINLTVKHNESIYGSKGYSKTVKIILKRNVTFDMQVSFPAGLLLRRFDQEGIGSLFGISIAAIAQFSFYDDKQIGRLKPFKFGAGFIALNAFNFSDNASVNRDIAVVGLASLYPINRSSKFSFPLHTGIGYLIKGGSWFLVFGPGIEIRF